jgi:site-specific DNA-methyltransferase (adenine-specific)
MPELADNSVSLVVTSPPYNVGMDYDTGVPYDRHLAMLQEVFMECHRVLEHGGRMVINVANLGRTPYVPFASHINRMLDILGFLQRGEIIWVKGNGKNNSTAWGSWKSASNPTIRDVHEYCLVFSKGDFKKNRKGKSTISGEDFMQNTLSVWNIQPESAKRIGHPAPFPVELPKRFIELYTYHDDLVLDPFCGSGTTCLAARQTGRRWVGYDTSQEYIDLATKRIRTG